MLTYLAKCRITMPRVSRWGGGNSFILVFSSCILDGVSLTNSNLLDIASMLLTTAYWSTLLCTSLIMETMALQVHAGRPWALMQSWIHRCYQDLHSRPSRILSWERLCCSDVQISDKCLPFLALPSILPPECTFRQWWGHFGHGSLHIRATKRQSAHCALGRSNGFHTILEQAHRTAWSSQTLCKIAEHHFAHPIRLFVLCVPERSTWQFSIKLWLRMRALLHTNTHQCLVWMYCLFCHCDIGKHRSSPVGLH